MELVRYNLDDAATKVGLSKKTLDDYLLQLRLGRKYGFDFKSNQGEKVGVLRNFIKTKRALEVKEKRNKKIAASLNKND